ncbi:MAG: hypothetical protein RJA57_146 [Bacteroidota bacterium]
MSSEGASSNAGSWFEPGFPDPHFFCTLLIRLPWKTNLTLSVKKETSVMRIRSLVPILLLSTLFACNEKEDLVTEPLTDYLPLAAGKYITYRLDSLVFPDFGRKTEVHKYQVRHQVDTLVTDNLGRPSWRIYRFIRDSAGLQPWRSHGTYWVTMAADQAENIDDNLRVIKLHQPVRSGFQWKGNRYLSDNPYGSLFNFSNDDNMADWDFRYSGTGGSFSYQGRTYTNVITVEQADESFNVPITSTNAYAARSRSVERYSKGIGLVYREYELWEYQPNTGGAGGPYKTGFGITQWMIDRN